MSELILIAAAIRSGLAGAGADGAQPAGPSAGGGGGGGAGGVAGVLGNPMIMMVLMFAVIYFMMIRPQQKRQKEHQAFLAGLKTGDQVVTSGGIHGSVAGVTEDVVTLEIAKATRVRIDRRQIAGPQGKPEGSSANAAAKAKAP